MIYHMKKRFILLPLAAIGPKGIVVGHYVRPSVRLSVCPSQTMFPL